MFCGRKVSRHYARHLETIHFEKSEATLEKSKRRVLYLWVTSKDDDTYHRPLPCSICHRWYMRLDTHLKDVHSKEFSPPERTELLNHLREKYWHLLPKQNVAKVKDYACSNTNFIRRHKPATATN